MEFANFLFIKHLILKNYPHLILGLFTISFFLLKNNFSINQLDLPEYQTKVILKKKLILAINEGKEGYGFI